MQMFAFDTETHLIAPGMLTPKLVCGSFYAMAGDTEDTFLTTPDDAIQILIERLEAGHLIIGANITYDFGVALAHCERDATRERFDRLMVAIFIAYDEARVWDVQIAEALYDLAQGHLKYNPRTNMKFDRYSLAIVVEHTLGRTDAKANDAWRLRYAELDGLPIETWPLEARVYPIDDVRNTYQAAAVQMARAQDTAVHNNIHDIPSQCRAAWALHLGAIWGFRVDQNAVNAYEQEIGGIRLDQIGKLMELGYYRANGTKDARVVKRAVALAYNPKLPPCPDCQATGFVLLPQEIGVSGKPLKQKTKACPSCDGLGLEIAAGAGVPLTPKEGVSASRDTLVESGDDNLGLLASYGETDKAAGTYIPFLRSAGETPLCLKPEVLLETGRTSYGDVIQQFPRAGRERECMVAREGMVYYSVDYTGIELAAHAQSCLWLLDHSKLAEVLNAGGKPHDMLAAKLYGKTDEEFALAMAAGDKRAKALRQAAKPANFGFPGGMGAVKLAQAQRVQGPNTTGPDGRFYRGLRFCILLGYAPECGRVKRTEYRGHAIPPLCEDCIQAAQDLRNAWFKQWPENVDYFDFINNRTGSKDKLYNFIRQHVSNRIRANVDYTSAANGLFQGLAADGAKAALYDVCKAQYVDRSSVLYGMARTILFAHDELIGEVQRSIMSAGVEEISRIMVAAMKRYIPDVVVEAQPTLMPRWYKQAELVRDAAGNVIPWEPKGMAA